MAIYKEYQPLRISSDWKIEWNCFFEIDPSEETMTYFAENLLFLYSENRNRSIELQWQPEDDVNGEYVLKVINLQEEFNKVNNTFLMAGNWGNPHLIYKSKKRLEIVNKIEELCYFLEEFKDERILKSRGIVDEKLEALRLTFLEKGYTSKIAKMLIDSKNSILQNLLLNTKEIDKQSVLFLSKNGAKKSIKNKAKHILKSKKFN
ncbi:hypothetical protein [Polaribacter sargassicola]|uniref:hypothetical protein n=1 Tax=Polaribacter sargassicola TaxID=2836891 RepID=UPI001F3E5734|nr:hypothetical protein [Polaribacter sp. DS7-9]MCG1035100.1 hypothetical protein [Polaribacter sp. DS7-9]